MFVLWEGILNATEIKKENSQEPYGILPFAAKKLSSVLKSQRHPRCIEENNYTCNDAFDWVALIGKMEWDVCF